MDLKHDFTADICLKQPVSVQMSAESTDHFNFIV